MSLGQAFGDAISLGYGLYDRDRQNREQQQAEMERERLRQEVQTALENLRAKNDRELEDRRFSNDVALQDQRTRASESEYTRRRNDAVSDAGAKAMEGAAQKYNMGQFLKGLPSSTQKKAEAASYGLNLDDDDLMTPEERGAASAAKLAADVEREEKISAARARGNASVKPKVPVQPKDDPRLPRGVRSWLATMPLKHEYDRDAAIADVRNTWGKIISDHPSADITLAMKEVDGLFGGRETAYAAPKPKTDAGGATSAAAPSAGRGTPAAQSAAAPKIGDVKVFPNGNKGRWDGKGWLLIQ